MAGPVNADDFLAYLGHQGKTNPPPYNNNALTLPTENDELRDMLVKALWKLSDTEDELGDLMEQYKKKEDMIAELRKNSKFQ